MKRILLIAAIALVAISCNRDFCQKKYPCNDVDSVIRITEYDTTYMQLPSDTTYIELPIDCPDQKIVYRDGKKEIVYKIKDRVLTVNQVTFADSLRIINQFKRSSEFKQYEKKVEVPVRYIPKFVYYSFAIMLAILAFTYRKLLVKILKWALSLFHS